jgi:hypothetical protein
MESLSDWNGQTDEVLEMVKAVMSDPAVLGDFELWETELSL